MTTATTLAFNLIFLGPLNMGIYGYVFAIIASDACSVLFLFVGAKLWKNVTFKKIPSDTRRDMLKYSIPMVPTIILWWIINVSDRYMVTGFVGGAENGLYTAASKIPNFVILFSTVFIDAWQLSAVDEYDSESREHFFTKVFRVYSGGVFVVASALILVCQILTKILVADSYYTSWRYVPVLIIATSFSCLVNFLASIYMAEDFVDAVETAIHERLSCAEAFEPYHSVREREHPYYRIQVKNYTIFYVVIGDTMEVRRIVYSRRDLSNQKSYRVFPANRK